MKLYCRGRGLGLLSFWRRQIFARSWGLLDTVVLVVLPVTMVSAQVGWNGVGRAFHKYPPNFQ